MTLFQLVAAAVPALGTAPVRFFEFGQAPQLEQLPYATFQHTTGTPYNNLSGPAPADHITTQIDVWATTSAECKTIASAIRSAIENDCYITAWLGTTKEDEIYRCLFTVQSIELRP